MRGRHLLRRAERDSFRVVEHRHDVSRRALALTFDDGPSQWTGTILDALAESGCRATFFILGQAIGGRESTLVRMRDEGHEIGNHSRSHARLDMLARRKIRAELAYTNQKITAVVGRPPHVFRPPYLMGSDTVYRTAAELGLDTVVFGSPVGDWRLESPAEIGSKVLAEARPGSIVLLHDGRPAGEAPQVSRADRQPTVEAVRLILPQLLERGYELVTVSELLDG